MQMILATATLMVLLCGLGPTMASPRRHIDPQADIAQEDQPQMTFINTDDYQSDDSLALQDPVMAAMVETFKVPKRTLSLLSRWKTPQQPNTRLYEQLQANRIAPPSRLESWPVEASALRQQRNKQMNMIKKEEMMSLPGLSEPMSMSNRAIPRSLRPPGQPLRWG